MGNNLIRSSGCFPHPSCTPQTLVARLCSIFTSQGGFDQFDGRISFRAGEEALDDFGKRVVESRGFADQLTRRKQGNCRVRCL
jgi:hypothetical protein